MNINYIRDNQGKTTAIQIPIDDWNALKHELEFVDMGTESIPEWQKTEVLQRIENHEKNSSKKTDAFDSLNRIERLLK